MTTHQKTLLNKGMYISLGLVTGIVIFAFTFGGSWAALESRVEANTEDITNIDGKLDSIDEKVTDTREEVIKLRTLLEQR